MRRFCISMGYVPFEDPEITNGMTIRISKNTYLHIPVINETFETKEDFTTRISQLAEEVWDRITITGLGGELNEGSNNIC